MLEELELITTTGVAMEVKNELGVDLSEYGIRVTKSEGDLPQIPENKKILLSDIDIGLISHSLKYKKRCLLITDDRALREVAKLNKIKCYTTPQFMAFLLKKGKISKHKCMSFLESLRRTYIRRKDVDNVLKRIEKGWCK
jgi:hypothetical protein